MRRVVTLASLLFVGVSWAIEKPGAKADATGSITGTVNQPKHVTAVRVINRSAEDDKSYPGRIDTVTGKFTVSGLPVSGIFDLVIDAGATRLEGVNLKTPRSDFEEEQPLTKDDVEKIKKICKLLNKFENEVEVMTVEGNAQHAVAVLNKRRTTPFYESKPGEMVWRLEVWRFEKPEETWLKSQKKLRVIHYRERLQKDAFAKKAVTLDPELGGLKVAKGKALDVGKVSLPDDKVGIHLRAKAKARANGTGER